MRRIIPGEECVRVYSYLGLDRAFRRAIGHGGGIAFDRPDSFLPTHLPGCELFCCGDTSRFPTAIVVPADPTADGDFETADMAAWTTSNCLSSKEAGWVGSRCARIAYDGSHSAGGIYQMRTVVGNWYRAYGQMRGDGTSAPRFLGDGVTYHWTGTASATPQSFDVTFQAANVYGPQFNSVNLSAGHYVEVDDFHLVPLNCSQYTDLTGLGHHPVQATAANQPLVVASGTGHLLRGDGTADYMAANYAADQPRTRYLLAKPTVQASARVLIDGLVADTGALKHKAASTTTQANAGSAFDGPVLTDATWQIFRLTLDGAASSIAINGGAPTVGDAGAGDPEGLTLGAAGGGAAGWAVADYACVLDYAGVHDAATAARVERYLSRLKQRLAL